MEREKSACICCGEDHRLHVCAKRDKGCAVGSGTPAARLLPCDRGIAECH